MLALVQRGSSCPRGPSLQPKAAPPCTNSSSCSGQSEALGTPAAQGGSGSGPARARRSDLEHALWMRCGVLDWSGRAAAGGHGRLVVKRAGGEVSAPGVGLAGALGTAVGLRTKAHEKQGATGTRVKSPRGFPSIRTAAVFEACGFASSRWLAVLMGQSHYHVSETQCWAATAATSRSDVSHIRARYTAQQSAKDI